MEFRFGESLSKVSATEESVEVTFESGSTETFDVLIGNDGGHSQSRRLAFGSGFEKPKDERLAEGDRIEFLRDTYAPYSEMFRHILEGLSESDAVFHDRFTRIVMPKWYGGRICLVGDAAYSPTPASGVGAAMATAGAYVLAKYLSEEASHEQAFANYDAYLRPTIDRAHAMASRMATLASGRSLISYEFTNALLRLLPVALVSRIHSHKIDMPLP